MSEAPSRLTLEADGDNFVLSRTDAAGVTARIPLTAVDLVSIMKSALAARNKGLSQRQPASGEVEAVLAAPVAEVAVHREILGDNVLLTMIATDGTRLAFALPSALAADVAERIARVAQEGAGATSARQ
jgi:hypothetical protein